MIAVFNRAVSAASLVVIAVLLTAVTPQAAQAHGGGSHESLSTRTHGPDTAGSGLQQTLPSSSVSPSCPAGSGGACCCGNLFALSSGGKTPPAGSSSGWSFPSRLPSGQTKVASAAPLPTLPPSPVLPRAPPLFS